MIVPFVPPQPPPPPPPKAPAPIKEAAELDFRPLAEALLDYADAYAAIKTGRSA